MTFGIQLIKDIYFDELNTSLIEFKKFLENSEEYTIKSNLDFLNEPDFIYSTEKIILYKYFSKYNRKGAFKLCPDNMFLFNLLNVQHSDINYIYPLCY